MKKYLLVIALVVAISVPNLCAQAGPGTTVGGVLASNQFTPVATAATTSGSVTNPAVNFLVQVLGGPVYFNGSTQQITQATIQLAANTTYLIVWSGFTEQLYAKTAVTGPGSSGTTVGVPTSLLFADPQKGEIALATVVCGATACGNTNGSITDNRAVANFPAGISMQGIAFANLPAAPDGLLIMCVGCTQGAAGATCTSGATNVAAMRLGGVWRCFLRDPEETWQY